VGVVVEALPAHVSVTGEEKLVNIPGLWLPPFGVESCKSCQPISKCGPVLTRKHRLRAAGM
jgi:hypothetical protein